MSGKRSRTLSFRASDEERARLEKIARDQDVTLGRLLYKTAVAERTAASAPPPSVLPVGGPPQPPPAQAAAVPAQVRAAPAPMAVYHVDEEPFDPLRHDTGATRR